MDITFPELPKTKKKFTWKYSPYTKLGKCKFKTERSLNTTPSQNMSILNLSGTKIVP